MRLFIIAITLLSFNTNAQYLLPQPKSVVQGNGKFKITEQTKVRIKGNSKNLEEYSQRFLQRLQFKSEIDFETTSLQDTASLNEILITIKSDVDTISIQTNESYKLTISQNKITLQAITNIGAYHGLETLLQLIQRNRTDGAFFKETTINDEPRFPWRGLLIDVCRHWVPVHIIKRNLDAMAAVKMNVLHLHLTEDQGFRIESKKFPKLHLLGSNGNFYTQSEIKSIVTYAHARGIRVIPEFDIPGHTTSWLVGHPELASIKKEYKIETGFGVFNPSLNPAEESTYDFLDTLITEMCELFPDAYFHIGGDENNGKDWDNNKKIQKFKLKNELNSNTELQAYFNKRIASILKRNNKQMIGWDEILNPNLPKSIVIQSWRGKKSMISAAQKGFPSILSNGYYLDKVESMKTYYLNDPLPANTNLTDQEQKLILGGEATMWSELVDASNIESRIWPSSLAIAERLWSQQKNCDLKSLYLKAPMISSGLQEFGLQHLSFQKSKLALISKGAELSKALPFLNALEPLKGYKRHQVLKGTPKYKTTAPLNRLADACLVESFTAYKFNQLINQHCLANGKCKNNKEIKHWLASWLKASESFLKISNQAQTFQEIEGLALNVQELCELAWRKVNSPSEISESENDRAIALIEIIEGLKLEIQFAPIKGIKKIFPQD